MTKRDGDDPAPVSEEYLRAHAVGELKSLSAPIPVVEYDPEWPRRLIENFIFCVPLAVCCVDSA
jgi:hypothetical protein